MHTQTHDTIDLAINEHVRTVTPDGWIDEPKCQRLSRFGWIKNRFITNVLSMCQ